MKHGDLASLRPEVLHELKIKVREVLANTEARLRIPIDLFYFKRLSYKEIAEKLDLPIGTVMSRIARAKVHLRKELARFDRSQEGESIFPEND